VLLTSVGYMGGDVSNPTYNQVSTGTTGHLEANQIIFNPNQVSYADLVRYFYEIHDFTQTNGQGPDLGPQYLSAIFYRNSEQQRTAQSITAQLQARGFQVATLLRPATPFFRAEDYHQDYYARNGKQPYCHVRKKIF